MSDPTTASSSFLHLAGAFCFGTVIGWTAQYILGRAKTLSVASITSFVGAIAGAGVVAIFKAPNLFATYCIGLALAYFARAFFTAEQIKKAILDDAAKAINEKPKHDQP